MYIIICEPPVFSPGNRIAILNQLKTHLVMKTIYLIPFILFTSCSTELSEPAITLRSADYITYNPERPCTGQEVTVTFDNGNNNCGVSRIQQRINDNWITVKEGTPQDGILTHSFTPQSPGSYRFRASWNKSGKNCSGENIKPLEEEPLVVVEDCCRDYFTATAVCDTARECAYGVELHFMTTIENWISITGQLPDGYEFCGLYDEFGNIIENYSGNVMQIIVDVPACNEVIFYAYFSVPVQPGTFGTWMVKDMQEVLYQVEVAPCEL